MKLLKHIPLLPAVFFIAFIGFFLFFMNAKPNGPSDSTSADASKYQIGKASSLAVVVNKGRVLPSDYTPAGLRVPRVPLAHGANNPQMRLRAEAASALEKLAIDAKNRGVNLMLASGYRSYEDQVAAYDSELKAYGQERADAESARAGHSEHQTGLAADLAPENGTCLIDYCFAQTPEGKWLDANAYKYGFIIRYPKGKDAVTGYNFEPWHVRYVGKDLAKRLHSSGETMEQFFSLPAYTGYPANPFKLQG